MSDEPRRWVLYGEEGVVEVRAALPDVRPDAEALLATPEGRAALREAVKGLDEWERSLPDDQPARIGAMNALLDAVEARKPLVWNGDVLCVFDCDVPDSDLWKAQASMVLDADDWAALKSLRAVLWSGEPGPASSALPDDQGSERAMDDNELREKVAEAIEERQEAVTVRRAVLPRDVLMGELADAAIEVMRGVSAAPAPAEQVGPKEAKAWYDLGYQAGKDEALPDGRGFTDEDVERGARALNRSTIPWMDVVEAEKDYLRAQVRAVLAAVAPKGGTDG